MSDQNPSYWLSVGDKISQFGLFLVIDEPSGFSGDARGFPERLVGLFEQPSILDGFRQSSKIEQYWCAMDPIN